MLEGSVVGLVTLQLTSVGILVAVLRFFDLRLDRRFAEVDRRFAEGRIDIACRFTEVGDAVDSPVRRDVGGHAGAGFADARDDRRRLEEKLDYHGKDIARLQGIVERTYEPQPSHRGHAGQAPGDGARLPRRAGRAIRRPDVGGREPVSRPSQPSWIP